MSANSYWDHEATYQIISKYGGADGISNREIDAFGVKRQQRTLRDIRVLLAEGRIENASAKGTPRWIAADRQPCPMCGRA